MARPGVKDRGLLQRKGSKDWWIRWICHLGHDHQEKAGSKSYALTYTLCDARGLESCNSASMSSGGSASETGKLGLTRWPNSI